MTHWLITFQVTGGSTLNGKRGNSEMRAGVLSVPSKIPQLDGPIPDPYDDVLSTPNVSNFDNSFMCHSPLHLFFFVLHARDS